jgi:hypothetical protein
MAERDGMVHFTNLEELDALAQAKMTKCVDMRRNGCK